MTFWHDMRITWKKNLLWSGIVKELKRNVGSTKTSCRSCWWAPFPPSVLPLSTRPHLCRKNWDGIGLGRWGYGPMTVVFSSSSSSLSFTLSSLPDIFFVFFFELKSISGLRTRPRSTGIRMQLTSPFLPPSVSRCEVEVGQSGTGELKDGGEGCCSLWGGSPANLLFNHPLSPAVHLDWFPNNKYFSLVLNSYIYPILLFHQEYFFH